MSISFRVLGKVGKTFQTFFKVHKNAQLIPRVGFYRGWISALNYLRCTLDVLQIDVSVKLKFAQSCSKYIQEGFQVSGLWRWLWNSYHHVLRANKLMFGPLTFSKIDLLTPDVNDGDLLWPNSSCGPSTSQDVMVAIFIVIIIIRILENPSERILNTIEQTWVFQKIGM